MACSRTIRGMTLALTDTATPGAPAVVLLHSSICDRRMWAPQLAALPPLYRGLAPDLRGFGDTPLGGTPHDDARDVLALLDGLGIDRFAVVGSSYGGRVALRLAGLVPERVQALALLCPAAPGLAGTEALEALDAREEELVAAGDLDGACALMVETWLGPGADASVRDGVVRMQRRAYEVQLAAPEGAGRTEEGGPVPLSAVTAPTLVATAAHDLPEFRALAAGLPARLAGARDTEYVDIPASGHLPSMERPEETTRLVRDFLGRHVK
ncbi:MULTISPECIES: alpha/beta hydrolase [unclassified Streptomyces]|uniref:alpha/beta fold hydrolase n=1 Tax=unclassified Streptomyces TaxID=2593676 RepID=UPI00081E28BD|nr:alpha/beta hydrolase [Streptomyces sp. LcepLS]MYR26096.1 alpha/beta fold hydrolase [Streptomyces sp. SID4945]SCE95394.1 Pimeloyl-ACP methyl ester carboxylesterase [Streptomyces sp. LcepLS]